MTLRFLHARRGNAFLRELLEALARAVAAEGVATEVVNEPAAQVDDDVVDVIIPHEFFGLQPELWSPERRRRQRTIALITEHPGTRWFEASCLAAGELARGLALNRSATVAARLRGLRVEHLQLGYVPEWDMWRGTQTARPIDITYLGISEARRNQVIGGYGEKIWKWHTSLLIPPPLASPTGYNDYLVGETKWRHLASSKVILNLHRQGLTDTEWPRIIEAMCNGAVVVTEHLSDSTPLQPGDHYIAAPAESLAEAAHTLLNDPAGLESIRRSAYEFVRKELPISQAAQILAETADAVRRTGRPSPPRLLPPVSTEYLLRSLVDERDVEVDPEPGPEGRVEDVVDSERTDRQTAAWLDASQQRSTADMLNVLYDARGAFSSPQTTVVMSVRNQGGLAAETIRSLGESGAEQYELIVVDNGSSDASHQGAIAVLKRHPEIPALLLRSEANSGTGWARNRGVEHARGGLVLLVEPGTVIYPPAIARLADALAADPGASLAYPIIATNGPDGVHGNSAWRPETVVSGPNPLDTLVLVRREVLSRHGGFPEAREFDGLDDYQVWRRIAAAGERGLALPEILGSYSLQAPNEHRNRVVSGAVTDLEEADARRLAAAYERDRRARLRGLRMPWTRLIAGTWMTRQRLMSWLAPRTRSRLSRLFGEDSLSG